MTLSDWGAGAVRPGAPYRGLTGRPGCKASDGAAGSASGAGATLCPSTPAQDAPSELTNARLAGSGPASIIFTKLRLRSSQAKQPPQTSLPALTWMCPELVFLLDGKRGSGSRPHTDWTHLGLCAPTQAGSSPSFSVPCCSHHTQLCVTSPPEQEPPDPHQVSSPS